MRLGTRIAAVGLVGLAAGSASAAVSIAQGASAPTYENTLNFDEPGQMTGSLPQNYWLAGFGLELVSFDGDQRVENWAGILGFPWLGTGNSFFGNFGVGVNFSEAVESFSLQVWDPSGPPSMFGGGMLIEAFKDGMSVASIFVTPAWAGGGSEWIDVTGSGGMTFDRVVFVGFGNDPTTFVDNLSWTVPAPGGAAVLGAVGLLSVRRRRR